MQKLKTKKGNTIIEGIVSLFIISLLIFASFDICVTSYKLRRENNIKEAYINVLDAVSKEIIYNKDYHFIEGLHTDNRLYIPAEYINMSSIENNDLNNLFMSDKPEKLPYLFIKIEDGDIYKVRLYIYYIKNNGTGEVYSDLFKGKY